MATAVIADMAASGAAGEARALATSMLRVFEQEEAQ